MERTGYWLHKWTDETSSFDPHGRWSGGLDCYERDYSMWIPDRIKPDDTVAVNDYIDRQFELSAEVADGLEVIDAADAQATIAALQARVKELCKFRQADHEQLVEVQKYWRESQDEVHELQSQLTQRTAELEAAKAELNTVRRDAGLDCGDHSCLYAMNKTGMRTNGGCRCSPKRMKNDLERSRKAYDDLQAELERVRSLIKALPKVEGEVTVRDITALCWANDGTYGSINCKEQLVSLLKHRQGMEGSHE